MSIYIPTVIYRPNICLKCGARITSDISNKRFCLMCELKHHRFFRLIRKLNFNFFPFYNQRGSISLIAYRAILKN